MRQLLNVTKLVGTRASLEVQIEPVKDVIVIYYDDLYHLFRLARQQYRNNLFRKMKGKFQEMQAEEFDDFMEFETFEETVTTFIQSKFEQKIQIISIEDEDFFILRN